MGRGTIRIVFILCGRVRVIVWGLSYILSVIVFLMH